MRRLPRADPGPVHPQSVRPHVARQVPPVQRMSRPAQREVLRPERSAVLQGRLLQVSIKHHGFCPPLKATPNCLYVNV